MIFRLSSAACRHRETWRHGRHVTALARAAVTALIGMATMAPAHAGSDGLLCNGCQLALGIGDTYHYWGRTGGAVLPVTFTWGDGRYEFGVFRFTTAQKLYEEQWGCVHVLAEPYWGTSVSRRWQLFGKPTWKLFFGFGVSYKNQEDALNSTHWNFASSLGVKLVDPVGKRTKMELSLRHWSNAGIHTPNRGQDFFTVLVYF